ncbi:hypothetical protein AVEN_196748-1 [Araneus ventricosus]|uniref:Uncharacterized protein n=1 Tax=Araneus ventricosus TaxID=182803 RepID=A0A4Y2RB14_ARAVE|nr:hypothetical protein AVEN_196748-1 [Araneus ventricosus]
MQRGDTFIGEYTRSLGETTPARLVNAPCFRGRYPIVGSGSSNRRNHKICVKRSTTACIEDSLTSVGYPEGSGGNAGDRHGLGAEEGEGPLLHAFPRELGEDVPGSGAGDAQAGHLVRQVLEVHPAAPRPSVVFEPPAKMRSVN